MMYKYLFLFTVLIISQLTMSGQGSTSPEILGILPFKVVNNNQVGLAKQVEAIVYEEIVNSRRLEIVEREFFNDLENEKWRQSTIDFIDGSVISKTQSIGAQHLMIGQITHCEVTRKARSSGGYYYSCDLKVSIRITDIETSFVSISDTWENNGILDFNTGDTEAKAMSSAANSMRRRVRNFLDDYFPVNGKIIQARADDSVIIGLGSSHGVSNNDRLIVYQTTEVAGSPFNEEVGEIKVTAVNGPDRSTATIKKGQNTILEGLRNNAIYYVKTKS